MRLSMLILALLVSGAAVPAVAGPLEDGRTAHDKGDYVTALRLWLPLAEQGNAVAQYNVGGMYASSRGVPRDYVQAYKWFNLTASRSSGSQNDLRELAIKGRDLVATRMTPAEVAEAQKLAREWKPKP
ncbi:MAG: sel1 repeat family protein [Rhodospirillaceae bacterium]|nr:sel1 repeat family protein [Rhodospirillaceae bacterium]